MVLPYDPLKGRKPSKAQLRQAERDEVACESVRLFGPPRLSYLAFFDDAEKRTAAGQKQTLCGECQRWRWSDESAVCRSFRSVKACGEGGAGYRAEGSLAVR